MNRIQLRILLALLLSFAAAASGAEKGFAVKRAAGDIALSNGVPFDFDLQPVSVATLINGMNIYVPGTASKLEVKLEITTPNIDFEFYGRVDQDVDLGADSMPIYTWKVTSPPLSPKTLTLTVTKTSPIPLRAGTYWFGLGIFTTNVPISGRITATYTDTTACTYSLGSGPFGSTSAQFDVGGGTGAISVTTGISCSWTATSSASWVSITSGTSGQGAGTINYRVDPNSGGQRQATITAGGQSFTINQSGVTSRTDGLMMPQFVNGGYWKTTIFLSNLSASSERYTLQFTDDNGNPWQVPLTDGRRLSELSDTLAPGQTISYETDGLGDLRQGSATLLPSTANSTRISGFAVVRQAVPGTPELEAAVPLTNSSTQAMVMVYDNRNRFSTGVALANPRGESVEVTARIKDDTGYTMRIETFTLPAHGHTAFSLPDRFAITGGRRGSILFTTGGAVSILGLRFNPAGAFTSFQGLATSDMSRY